MNTRGTPGGQAPGAGRAVYRMSREQAISEVLGRLDQPALSDQRKLEVPLGWEQRNSRRGWRKDAIELRLKSLRILLHPDKSTPSKRDRFTEALQELMACGDRILGVSSQKQVHTPEPPSPVSSDFATPPPMTPPSAKKRREKARKLRDQLLNEDKTDKERMRAPPNTVSAGLRWSVASIEQRYEAIGAFLRGNIPAGKSADPFWADAFTALEAVRERLLAEAAAGRAPRAPPSPGPPADPNAVAAQHQGDGEMLVFWMSGTHTPTAHHGKKIKDEPSRHASVGRFIDWVGPVLAAGEGQWVATGPKTWSYSRERGQGVGHNHGQSLTGVLAVSAEAAEATLKAVCHLFSTGDSTFFIQHRIHDKGDNRDIGVAFGYTLKDGGGGVQPRRHHYKNCNNFGEVDGEHAIENSFYTEWFATADTSGWAFEKTGFNWSGDGTGAKKIIWKKSSIIPQVIVGTKRDMLLEYDVTFVKRCAWQYSKGGVTIDPSLVLGSYGSTASEVRLEALSIIEENHSACLQSTFEMRLVLCGLPPGQTIKFDGVPRGMPRRVGLSPLPRRLAEQLDIYEVLHHRDTGELPVRLVSLPRDIFPEVMFGVGLVIDLGYDSSERNGAAGFVKRLVEAGFDMTNLIYGHRGAADTEGHVAVGACIELLRVFNRRGANFLKNYQEVADIKDTQRIFDRIGIADFMYILSTSFGRALDKAKTLLEKRGVVPSRYSLLGALLELYHVDMPSDVPLILHPADDQCRAYSLTELDTVLSAGPLEDGLHLFFCSSHDSAEISANQFAAADGFDMYTNLSPTTRADGTALPQKPPHVFFASVWKWSESAAYAAAGVEQPAWQTPAILRSTARFKTPTAPADRPAASPGAAATMPQPNFAAAAAGPGPSSPLLQQVSPHAANVQPPPETQHDDDEDFFDEEAEEAMHRLGAEQ